MERFNYNHLFYFWTVARLGSIRAASGTLGVSQPTISEQLQHFEKTLGRKVFQRSGRSLRLTEAGTLVFESATRMFEIGNELHEALSGNVAPKRGRVTIGVSSSLPQTLVARVLAQLFQKQQDVRISCVTDREEALLAAIGSDTLDVVLSSHPARGRANAGLSSYDLSVRGVSFVASRALTRARKTFPAVLNGVPFLMPGAETSLHSALARWFEAHQVRPEILGSISDHALLTQLAARRAAAIAVPSILEREVRAQHAVALLGRTKDLSWGIYGVAPRSNTHPLIKNILHSNS